MKTRTLLLLSVGTALMILLAGGVLLVQLSGQDDSTEAVPLDVRTTVGDADITVAGASVTDGTLRVEVEIGGVDDVDGIDNFALVTGDQRLAPLRTPEPGRCVEVTEQLQRCTVDFDVSRSEGSSRVLVLRRGDDQATWRLA